MYGTHNFVIGMRTTKITKYWACDVYEVIYLTYIFRGL